MSLKQQLDQRMADEFLLYLSGTNSVSHEDLSFEELLFRYRSHPTAKKLQERLQYHFSQDELFLRAFSHRSFVHEHQNLFEEGQLQDNQQLEFLGDSILGAVVSIELCARFSSLREGELSKLRGAIVREVSLFQLAKMLELENVLLVGKGEIKSAGLERPSVLSDAFEAMIGAIYVDSDFSTAQKVILNIFELFKAERGVSIYAAAEQTDYDAKSLLQEKTMELFRSLPEYRAQEIADGKISKFIVQLFIDNKEVAQVEDSSKKKAEKKLAQMGLQYIRQGRE